MSAQKPNFLDVLEARQRAQFDAAGVLARRRLRTKVYEESSWRHVSEIRLSGEGPLQRIWNNIVDSRGKR